MTREEKLAAIQKIVEEHRARLIHELEKKFRAYLKNELRAQAERLEAQHREEIAAILKQYEPHQKALLRLAFKNPDHELYAGEEPDGD